MVPILGGHSEARSPLDEATTTGGGESKSKPSHFIIFHISWGHSIYHWRFLSGITHKWDWWVVGFGRGTWSKTAVIFVESPDENIKPIAI